MASSSKLVGTNAGASAGQGLSVHLNYDGSHAMTCSSIKKVWFFNRTNGTWQQNGPDQDFQSTYAFRKFCAIDANGRTAIAGRTIFVRNNLNSWQLDSVLPDSNDILGSSVSISSSGQTIIVGAEFDDNGNGSAYVFQRSGSLWTQDQPKLKQAPIYSDPPTSFGSAVALSGDGQTALVADVLYNSASGTNNWGGVWVFGRNPSGIWEEQSDPFINIRPESRGFGGSIALSYDGNVAVVGTIGDNFYIITRDAFQVWHFDPFHSYALPGYILGFGAEVAVSISSDGSTIAISVPVSDVTSSPTNVCAFVFARTPNNDVIPITSALVGVNSVANTYPSSYIGISGDGNYTILGSPTDNNNNGATWVFVRTFTSSPSFSPSRSPTTSLPSLSPSKRPSNSPATTRPSISPTTVKPSISPSTTRPSISPSTTRPSRSPSKRPSFSPHTTSLPTMQPSVSPVKRSPTSSSKQPSISPSRSPTISMKPTASAIIIEASVLSVVLSFVFLIGIWRGLRSKIFASLRYQISSNSSTTTAAAISPFDIEMPQTKRASGENEVGDEIMQKATGDRDMLGETVTETTRQQLKKLPPLPKTLSFYFFAAHNWGINNRNHLRVLSIVDVFRKCGRDVWFDDEHLSGNIDSKICHGIDDSAAFVVFVTKDYLEKLMKGAETEQDWCYFEFTYASQRKPTKMIAVIMEEEMLDTSKWKGPISARLGTKLYVDFTSDDKLDSCVSELSRRIAQIL